MLGWAITFCHRHYCSSFGFGGIAGANRYRTASFLVFVLARNLTYRNATVEH